MTATEAVLRARALIENVTPLKSDCGRVCGAACCAPDEDGQGGMLLFPGEEALYSVLPEGFSLKEDHSVLPGMTLLTCSGQCDRTNRPLACRLFPLTPVLKEDGRIALRMDPRAFSCCPLAENGPRALDPAFIDAAREAARELCQSDENKAYLTALIPYFESLRRELGD